MWPVLAVVGLPKGVDSTSRVGRSDEGGRLRVGSTSHRQVVGTLDGARVADLTNGRAWDRISSSNGTLVHFAINGNLTENTVGPNKWEECEGDEEECGEEESCGLHCLN